jgi:serine/threonine-protein kinase 24/25/MST4
MTDDKAITDDMDAREIESLSMLSRGFQELRDVNPELSFNVILDILAGLNEYVETKTLFFGLYLFPFSGVTNGCVSFPVSNAAVRQHVHTSRILFPHRRVTRKSEMTNRGLVVTEVVEDVAGPSGPGVVTTPTTPGADNAADASPVKRSPIAELLYMRWLEGLKIKWPNILSSS